MRTPDRVAPRMHPDRPHPRRRALIAACVSLLAVTGTTSCASTTQNGTSGAATAADPSVTRSGTAQTGPIRVTFEVDTYPDELGKPIPTAVDSPRGKALLKFVEKFNTTLPPGGRRIEAHLISSADLGDSWGTDNASCTKVLPPSDPAPDIFVPYQESLGLESLGCFVKAGTILMLGQPAVVPSAWLTATPGAFLLRGTTFKGWATAASAALDSGATPPPKRVVVMGPKLSINMQQALADASYQEVVDALQRPGRTVTLFNSPESTADVASSEAAFALVPTKLRRLGVDALVLPGVVWDPIPAVAMNKQQFTPPAIVAAGAVVAAKGYPIADLRSLPAPSRGLDAKAAAIRLRSQLAGTAEGRSCLEAIEPDGRKVDADTLIVLTMECDVLRVVTSAVSAKADALTSPQTFGAALTAVRTITLADGTTATFGAQPQLGAADLVLADGDARCNCFIPTGKSFPVTP